MKTEVKKKRKRPRLENYQEVVSKVLDSIARHSGYSSERIRNNSDHLTVGWRHLAMYVLQIHYDWTLRGIAEVFDQTAQNVYTANNAFEAKLNDEEKQHEYSPILRKVIEDLEL
tara:strand:- start:35205 stop:35546 length:342 start_codon:yes stop_codon:yes gene_type:complete